MRYLVPWALRAFLQQPLSQPQELLEVLVHEGEPLVSAWARQVRRGVRDVDSLALELARLEADGGPVALSLAAAARRAWHEFGGEPLLGSAGSPRSELAPRRLQLVACDSHERLRNEA